MALKINDLQAVLEINRKINSIGDVKSILNDISHYAGVLLNSEGASILLVDQPTGNLHFEVAFGQSVNTLLDIIVPKGKGIAGFSAATKQHVVVNDAQNDERFYKEVDEKTNIQTRSLVAMPLVHKDTVIGVIEVINPENGIFTEDDIILLRQFAEQAAIAIANALLYKQLMDKASELEYLYQISNLTNTIYDKRELFDKIAILISKAFSSNRVSIMFINEESGKLYIESSVGIPEDVLDKVENSINLSKISSRVITLGKVVFGNDIEKAGHGRNKKLRYSKTAFISLPIKVKNIPIGVINISEPNENTRYSTGIIKTLETIANQLGHSYESILNHLETIENEKIRKEIDIMKTLQNALLIKDFSNYKNISIYARMVSAEVVGGDFYDVYRFSPARIGFVIGDVSGKGLPASLYMAVSRSVIKAYAYQISEPSKLLEYSNEILVDDSRVGMFVTVFYGILDLESRTFVFSNAGHNQQYLYNPLKGEFYSLSSKGIPLGISRLEKYQPLKVKLDSGDIIFSFTDGVTDAVNDKGEDFGLDRLKNVVKNYAPANSPTIVNSIIREVDAWANGVPQWDDITVIAFKMP